MDFCVDMHGTNIIKQEQEGSTFTCEICIEPTSSNKKFTNSNGCVHPFCLSCLAKYVQAKVEDNVASVKCPGLGCEKMLDPLVCRPYIPSLLFNNWCKCLCDAAVLRYDLCYCPNKNCSELIINECGETVTKSKCPNCKQLLCFKCKLPWHAGYWCKESRESKDANDIKFGELLEMRQWTRCYSCGQAVERIDGCRLVRCRCGTTFCHKCGQKYHMGKCNSRDGMCCCCCLSFFLIFILFITFLLVVSAKK